MSNSLLAGATTATATTTSANSTSSTSSSTSTKATGIASGMGQDAFLKMFMAQMTNQNPLDPMDNTQFTAQLAQFSSLEQLTQINTNLKSLTSLTDAINQTQALSYLGKDVTVSGNQLTVNSGAAGKTTFSLAQNAEAKATISDSSGKVVATRSLGYLYAGNQSFTWDGKYDDGTTAADGAYTISVTASDDNGASVKVGDLANTGRVTGFKKDSSGVTYLLSGGVVWAKLSDVVSVSESKTTSTDSALADWLASQASSASSSASDSSSQSFSDWLQSLVNQYSGS